MSTSLIRICVFFVFALPGATSADIWNAQYDDQGKMHGTAERWSDDEKRLFEITEFHKGVRHGLSAVYHPNQKVAVESTYKDGQLHGPHSTFYEGDGNILKEKGQYKNGKADGLWIQYFPNAQKQAEINYVRGQLDGEMTEYYTTTEAGKTPVKRKLTFRKGLKHGSALTAYDNAENSTDETGEYKSDQRFGPWEKWYPNGNLASEIDYYADQKHGAAIQYYPSGLPEYETTFEYNEFTGEFTGYHEAEPLQPSIHGKHIAGKRQGMWTSWAADGTKTTEVNYRLGTYDGVSITYYAVDGSIDTVTSFKNGVPDGDHVRYHFPGPLTPVDELVENGPRKSKVESGQHSKGQRVGSWYYYYPSGTLRLESAYDDLGRMTGVWYYYDELEEMTRVETYEGGAVKEVVEDCLADPEACESWK
ncbi:MAG: toxin-antitoxin system YwqK family antitoxin [Tateyamaria sp.]|uniref:toxin-antitoxin system YwqK family antitoxin n=1 Tax=Roseobacteraceae TaxID=2854170 RepID=UPI0032992D8C